MLRHLFLKSIARFLVLASLLFSVSLTAHAEEVKKIDNLEILQDFMTQLAEKNNYLKDEIINQKNTLLSITESQKLISTQIDHVQNTLATLDEQGEWLSFSTALGETLRQQLLRLPEKPKSQVLDVNIAEAKLLQLNYNEQISTIDDMAIAKELTVDNKTLLQYKRLVKEHKDLLKTLVSGCDTEILELTKLKIANKQLINAIDNVNDAAHRYFFWVADINPVTAKYPMQLGKDLIYVIFSAQALSQISNVFVDLVHKPLMLIALFWSIMLVIFHFKSRQKYQQFLATTASKVGKVSLDSFYITLRVVIYSLLMALPIPILWGVIGYWLQMDLDYPVAVALGYGINAAAPILWVFMISAQFASPNGLYISHFGWPAERVRSAMKYYKLSVWVIIPLGMLVVSFDQFNNRQFAATIGRFSFILLCFALVFMTNSIHRAGVPLYIDKKGHGDNLYSRILWIILLSAPWFAIIAACLGYLSTAQVLLGRLEISVVLWLAMLVAYFMIRRWMWIQRRRIEFERAKQRRLDRIQQRSKSEEEQLPQNVSNAADMIEEPIIDLDVISSKSLHLVRSIIVMITLIGMILLWSELHSAFAFMDNIRLWNSKLVINGKEIEQYITLSSLFIAVLTITITIQLVKNLPALLELGILQHLDLAPGTGYAITTISKYIILMIGSMISFSFIGIDWNKIQWLIAALGVGLGFGLQEIFANFVSGIIMLFEKPVRIGDTVTIRDLTGKITKINTRATTIVDWDRKEIVMPNRAFVTEQLINWSLSDAITRIVLTIPATIDADSSLVVQMLKDVAQKCESVLNDPEPQVFLVDIQEGIQLYELRIFAPDITYRMPLRSEIHQLIIDEYHKHNLTLPFPPLQTNLEALGRKNRRRIFTAGSI